MTSVSINGRVAPLKEARVSVFDHGFLYGDSVYETMRTFGGVPWLFQEHLARLKRSCEAIQIPLQWDNRRFVREMEKLTRIITAKDYVFRIIVTRGEGRIGYRRNKSQEPTIVIICNRFKGFATKLYRSGITLITSNIRRNPVTCLDPAIKSSNLQALRLAYMEASEKGGDEALILNINGEIAECSSSSVFFVKKGRLFTPSLDTGILQGLTREFVISLARSRGMTVKETRLSSVIIDVCEECFITSTIKSILPVRRIDNRIMGEPGPVTRKLMKAFDEGVTGEKS